MITVVCTARKAEIAQSEHRIGEIVGVLFNELIDLATI